MQSVSTRRVELNKYSNTVRRSLDATVRKYREACAEILLAVKERWNEISEISSSKDRLTYVEKLIHATKNNPAPAYPLFDKRLYKLPSYYRRAAINFVVGAYSSYISSLKEYNKNRYEAISNGKKFRIKPPRLESMNSFPVLYRKNTYNELNNCTFEIKIFIRNTWDFVRFNLPARDKKDLMKQREHGISLSPTLVFAYGKYNLDFPIEHTCVLSELGELRERRILAVDMGINNDAVCSVMSGDGTVESRHFINLGSEKDRLNRLLNRAKKLRRLSGTGQELTHIWTKIDRVKENHAKQLASRICKLAVQTNVDVVVLEHLDKMKPSGKKKERIHHWCKRKMQDLLCGMLWRNGIHYSKVNPRNTSALAYDGSGIVKRSKDNFSICKFQTGKVYNCDLNASYNIGARYFIREFLKSLGETQELQLKAKVPESARRTDCTYATYRAILSAA